MARSALRGTCRLHRGGLTTWRSAAGHTRVSGHASSVAVSGYHPGQWRTERTSADASPAWRRQRTRDCAMNNITNGQEKNGDWTSAGLQADTPNEEADKPTEVPLRPIHSRSPSSNVVFFQLLSDYGATKPGMFRYAQSRAPRSEPPTQLPHLPQPDRSMKKPPMR